MTLIDQKEEQFDPDSGLSLIVPAFNEEQAIQSVLAKILGVMKSQGMPFELIIVDDGSTDQTGKILEQCLDIKLVRHSFNRGYGAALKTGLKEAQFSLIGIVDADGTYPIERIPDLLEAMEQMRADMVVAARTGETVHISWVRKPAKWMLKQLAQYLSGVKIPDLNSGLRIMKKDVVERFRNILPNGFSFTTTITLAMLTNDYKVEYIPINYHKRPGRSKIRPVRDTFNFVLLVIRTVMYFNPLSVFLPLSMSMFIVGGGLLLVRLFVAKILISTTVMMFVGGFTILAIGLLADLIDKRMS